MAVTTPDDPPPARERMPAALIATLITIPVMVIVGFIAFAALRSADDGEVSTPIDAFATTSSTTADCADFLAALPTRFDGFGSKQISAGAARWAGADVGDPILVRCGVQRPGGLSPTSALHVVNGIQWLITDTVDGRGNAYVCVDHRPYVALWAPISSGNAATVDVSAAIGTVLTSGPLDFG
ncbi:MAG: DUF3515 domain-containing protein [Gordonia sp. (in: high G+C Gram-positive bacteria)]